jgi:flavin reductase (DIM6/NTAB) family NADH-FMN oxidoreductase RutF
VAWNAGKGWRKQMKKVNNKRKSFSPGALSAPLPPAMVTVGNKECSNIITIAWTGILATQPPKTYISVRPSRHSYQMLKENGEFVINLPSVSLAKTVDYVGIYTGAKVDKWKNCNLTATESEKVAPPTIAECPVALECRVCEVLPMGSHDVFMADIVSVSCREDIIDENGKMRFDRADLLAYAHGEYYSLGEVVGRFGFSTDKPKKEDKTNKNPEKDSEKQEKHRPFYLDAPRGKGGKSSSSKNKRKSPSGKGRIKK